MQLEHHIFSTRHAFAISAYGESPHLPMCLNSICNQANGNSDILLTTSTPSLYLERIAAHYDVPLIVNPVSAGIAADWNFALMASNAMFITVAHQDDWYAPDYSVVMLEALNLHPDALIAFCNNTEHTPAGTRDVNLNLRIKRLLSKRAFGKNEAIADLDKKRQLLTLGNPVCCPSVIFNRRLVPDFRFANDMKSNLDWDAWARLAVLPGEFVYIRTPLVSKGVHGESETSALIANEVREKEDRQMFDRFWPRPMAAAISMVYKWGYRSNRL